MEASQELLEVYNTDQKTFTLVLKIVFTSKEVHAMEPWLTPPKKYFVPNNLTTGF